MGSSQISHVVIVLLLLGVFPCIIAEFGLPSIGEPHSITGRKSIIYRPNGDIFARPSGSKPGGGRSPAAP